MQPLLQQLALFLKALPPGAEVIIWLSLGALLLCAIFTIIFLTIRLRESNRRLQLKEQTEERARQQLVQQEIRSAKLITMLKNERRQSSEKLQLLEEAREQLRLQFGALAQQIFDDKTSRFTELNREKLESILEPFNQQLNGLKQEITSIYRADSRERIALKHEILQLRDLNQQINKEAANLTRALKSDTKLQGNWGELILERVLEVSGLRAGREYDVQGSFRDHDNRLLRPDVIVHLPEGRDIIVDSKVSLIAWEKFVNTESESQQAQYLKQLNKAVRDHVAGLSAKGYQELDGLYCLDFVLLFMPIEAAFAAVVESDPDLLPFALEKNIIIVTPTTLLATLRTIDNLWKVEQQSKNSLEIARRAGLLYDKLCAFVEDMEKVGRQLATCRTTYDQALGKLSQGRGNLISQADHLKELGVKARKEMPRTIAEMAEMAETSLKN